MSTTIGTRSAVGVVALVLLVGVGIVANPFVTSIQNVWIGVLAGEWIAAWIWIGIAWWHGRRKAIDRVSLEPSPIPLESRWGTVALVGIVVLWSAVNAERWSGLSIHSDDAYYLGNAVDWPTTRSVLLQPFNEHYCVPQRVLNWLVVAAGQSIGIGHAMQALGTLLFGIALVLLQRLGRTLWREPTAPILVVAAFALSASYGEVFTWYSASLWLVTVILLLTALLCVEWQQFMGPFLPPVLAFASVFSYSIGLLVGPISSAWSWSRRPLALKQILLGAVPTLATVVSVAWILPGMLRWFETTQYLAKSSRESLRLFDPLGGFAYSARFCVDGLLLRNLGCHRQLPPWAAAAVFPLLAAGVVWMLRRYPTASRLGGALAMILLSYSLVLPFRTFTPYRELSGWTRYNLIPQIGVALLLGEFWSVAIRPYVARRSNPATPLDPVDDPGTGEAS